MPIFRSWFTDVMSSMSDSQMQGMQNNYHCADFQMNFFECLEAYGSHSARTKCADFYDDYRECGLNKKQKFYIQEMRRERLRQLAHGERKASNYWGPKIPDDAFINSLFH